MENVPISGVTLNAMGVFMAVPPAMDALAWHALARDGVACERSGCAYPTHMFEDPLRSLWMERRLLD